VPTSRFHKMPALDKHLNKATAFVTGPVALMKSKAIETAQKLRHAKAVGAATMDGWSLEHAGLEMRGDKAVVLASVRSDGRALRYASEALRADREVVLAAVTNQGLALKFASDALRGDFQMAVEALRSNSDAYFCANETLMNDKQFIHVSQNIFNNNMR